MTAPQQPGPLARVVLLAGPSGCGKTFLAHSLGVPMISLDNFYRVGEDRDLPRSPDGAIDWESPRSWNTDGARRALNVLCSTGQAHVPEAEEPDRRASQRCTSVCCSDADASPGRAP